MSKHTPGPWHVGRVLGQHLELGSESCRYCNKDHPLLGVTEGKTPYPERFSSTVHLHLWLADEDCPADTIVSADGTEIVGMYDYEMGGVCTGMADARLIAAAPDLLEALKKIEALEVRHAADYQAALARWAQEVGNIAREAIAKAEGGDA